MEAIKEIYNIDLFLGGSRKLEIFESFKLRRVVAFGWIILGLAPETKGLAGQDTSE